MLITDFVVGRRVRLKEALSVFNLDDFPLHAAGTVVASYPDAPPTDPIASVLMDDHFAGLNEWNNMLEVYRDGAEVTPDTFEPTGD